MLPPSPDVNQKILVVSFDHIALWYNVLRARRARLHCVTDTSFGA